VIHIRQIASSSISHVATIAKNIIQTVRSRLPPLCENNIKKASDPELEKAEERCEAAALAGGFLVIVGLIVEVVIAYKHPLSNQWVEKWGSVGADFLVAIGVSVEVLLGMLGRRYQSELTRRSKDRLSEATRSAGEANERAEEARKRTAEIERLTAWRRVDPSKATGIICSIAPLTDDITLLVEYQQSDPEAYLYARDILSIFWQAGVKSVLFGANSYLSGDVFDTWICGSPTLNVEIMAAALIDGGVALKIFSKDLSTFKSRYGREPNLYLFVGPKLPEFMKSESGSIPSINTSRELNI